jgi:hypothetical protein
MPALRHTAGPILSETERETPSRAGSGRATPRTERPP